MLHFERDWVNFQRFLIHLIKLVGISGERGVIICVISFMEDPMKYVKFRTKFHNSVDVQHVPKPPSDHE